MRIFDRLGEHDYERLVFVNDNEAGLSAIIALHDTTLGPALGGVRMRPFRSEEEAIDDVLRLARGMTYKAAISGVDLGGGKTVVFGDPRTDKTPRLLHALGRAIESLGGAYIAGQDIGTDSHDMAVLRTETRFVSCVGEEAGGPGDPSETTAFGAVAGIKALLEVATGSHVLEGRRIAVQGVGNTGQHLARFCRAAGAEIVASDIDGERLDRAATEIGAEIVAPDAIYSVECDVFAPCSIGAVLDDETIPRLRCRGVAGTANNVLAEPKHARALEERGILYAPDYLVNSGGLVRCQAEVLGSRIDEQAVRERVAGIYEQTLEVLRRARETSITSAEAADCIAEERLAAARSRDRVGGGTSRS